MPWRKIMARVGIEPLTIGWQTSTLTTKPRGYLDRRSNHLSACSSFLAAKLRPGCFLGGTFRIEYLWSVYYTEPRQSVIHQYTHGCITLQVKTMNALERITRRVCAVSARGDGKYALSLQSNNDAFRSQTCGLFDSAEMRTDPLVAAVAYQQHFSLHCPQGNNWWQNMLAITCRASTVSPVRGVSTSPFS
jgi:hypothetical protein